MNYSSVPIIIVCCYLFGEIYKGVFSKNKKMYKLIPVLMTVLGGIISVLIYYTNPEMIFNAENIWIALGIGITSGASSTGANQIVKQLFRKEKK